MKNIILKTGIVLILTLLIAPSLFTIRVSAEEPNEYKVLVPLPGVADNVGDSTTLKEYLPAIFNLLIGLAAVAAVLNIVIGGFQYMTTDAVMKKGGGIKRIQNAVFSLVLIIAAWLILYTINPALLEFNLNIKPAIITAPPGEGGTLGAGALPGYKLDATQIAADGIMRTNFPSGITVNNPPCSDGGTSGCTNVVGLPQGAIIGLATVQAGCTFQSGSICNIKITGGTEGGHVSHGPGIPVVDLAKNSTLDSFITTGHTSRPTAYGPVYDLVVNGQKVSFLDEGANVTGSTGAHWHVQFN